MNELIQEAIEIVNDLGDVIFIGAVAVMLHTKMTRESLDLDFVVAKELTNEFLEDKRYFKFEENGKSVRRTPRGYKIDIYSKDVSGIPLKSVINTAREIQVRKNQILKAASVEVLIVAKHRSARLQDSDDLRTIAKRKFKEIDWKSLDELTDSDVEFKAIRTEMTYFSK
ncbi:MAG: hypothetical protein ACYC6W_10275 [Nitrosotalea sp.]